MSDVTTVRSGRSLAVGLHVAIKWAMAALVCLTVVLRAGAAEASHFRYGTINWSVPDPVNAPRTVNFTVTTAWRSDFVDTVALNFGDGTATASPAATTVGTGVDSLNQSYVVRQFTTTHTYAAAGVYTAFFTGSARVAGLVNGAGGSFTVQSKVAVGGTPANSAGPTSAAPAVIQLQVGATRTYSFPMFDADGDPATCRFATGVETGLTDAQSVPTVPAGGAQPTLTASGNNCIVTWNLSQATAGQQYVLHLVMESTHNGAISSTAIDLITEMVSPPPPVCAGTAVFNVTAGQLVTAPTSATWSTVSADGGNANAAVSMINAPAGAVLAPGGSGSSPFSNVFSWTPALADLGTTKVVIVNYVDPRNLSCAAYITINTAACPVCSGVTPFCDPALRMCSACTADSGGAGVKACASATPTCMTTGACGKCTSNTDCTTGVTHAGPYCDLASGACAATCSTDAQCGASAWCNSGVCDAKLANGVAIPTNPTHSPVLNATCSGAVATAVCASGTCDSDGSCGLRNGTPIPAGLAASVVCRAGVGDADGACGLRDGTSGCTAGDEALVCRSSHCATTGPNAGRCVACTADTQCLGATAACSAVSNTCVQCTPTNATACGGTTPRCDTAQGLCVACSGDQGSPGPLACPVATPLCVATGPQTGSCGACASRADCAGATHAGPVCDPVSGACGITCIVDGDCDSSEWCNVATCTAKLTNGALIPTVATHNPPLIGICTQPAANAVCATGVCDADQRCGLLNDTAVPANASGASVCRSGISDADGRCGLANGSSQCTANDAATRCRSALCATGGANVGKCVACLTDASCNGATPACDTVSNTCAVCTSGNATACGGSTPLCNTSTRACVACAGDFGGTSGVVCPIDLPYCVAQGNGAGRCTKCTARSECSVGTHPGPVCDVASGSCGSACVADADCAASEWCNASACAAKLANGRPIPTVLGHTPELGALCTAGNGAAVCASGVCATADNLCGLPNGATVPSGKAGTDVCRAGVADSDGKCGYANGTGPCASSNGALVCRSTVCATTGVYAGLCVACINDASCGAPTPACDVAGNVCAACTASNAALCTGATPVCDAALRKCAACAADAKMGVVGACPIAAPYCVSSGTGAGSCGKCTQRSDCAGDHNGPVCDVATGACGVACERDGDCDAAAEYCTATADAAGICASKVPNGVLLPEAPPDVSICTETAGLRVCLSGACDADDGKCGRITGHACTLSVECRSARCSEVTHTCVTCESDAECGGGTYCATTGICSTKKADGEVCVRAEECASDRCDNDVCGGTQSKPDAGVMSEAGGKSNTAPRKDVTIEGGGLSCAVNRAAGSAPSSNALWGFAALALAGAGRRRKRWGRSADPR